MILSRRCGMGTEVVPIKSIGTQRACPDTKRRDAPIRIIGVNSMRAARIRNKGCPDEVGTPFLLSAPFSVAAIVWPEAQV